MSDWRYLSIEGGLIRQGASAATILLIAGYARSVLQRRSLGFMVGAVLAILYTYLYILLQVEDYALLLGSIGLFVLLGVVMFLTRRVNWYAVEKPTAPPPPPISGQ